MGSSAAFTLPTGLRLVAVLARVVFGGLLATWLLLVLAWAVLHGWIVPRVDEWRPQVEQQATRVLGIPVRIGQISAETVGLVPSFGLSEVRFLDPQGRTALNLGRVVVALSPRSVLRLGFEQLVIDRPVLDVRRLRDGRITVAGLDAPDDAANAADDTVLDWLFAQRELVIREGVLRWTDEQRNADALVLTQFNLLARNTARRHGLRIDATLPPAWGGRPMTLVAQFRQPLLALHASSWRHWDGSVYAATERVDVAQLRRYVNLGAHQVSGDGALRAWLDVRRGQWERVTADLALAQVRARLGENLEPMRLTALTGRLGLNRLSDGYELVTERLHFRGDDGREWPGGNVRVQWRQPGSDGLAHGEVQADRLDLQALSHIAGQLPLGSALHQALRTHAPAGLVEAFDLRWDGHPDTLAWARYSAKGKVAGLSLAAGRVDPAAPLGHPARPGVTGANVDFDFNQAGGRAHLAMARGSLSFPGVFEEPTVPVDSLAGDFQWTVATAPGGPRIVVQMPRLRLTNADADIEAHGTWQTADAARSAARSRFPGVLDLTGTLARGAAERTHRYLPIVLPAAARHYVRDALRQGSVSNGRFRVRGDLWQMPFAEPGQGEFRIDASVRDGVYAYVPLPPGTPPQPGEHWPMLTQVQGEVSFEGAGMAVKNASARIDGLPGLQVLRGEAQVPRFGPHMNVAVVAEGRGPASEALALVADSPLRELTARVLDHASATGPADLRLRLNLPLDDLHKTRVQGTVQLPGNDVRLLPDLPPFAQARGAVSFSETGFALQGVQANFLGGDIRVEGGLGPATRAETEPQLLLRAQGTASAEGLRQAPEFGPLARLAQQTSGSAAYSATLGWRHGAPQLSVSSNLQGLAVQLPAPLGKPAETQLPMRYHSQALAPGNDASATQEEIQFELQDLLQAHYVRRLGGADDGQVLRGALALGAAAVANAPPAPEHSVAASVALADVDVDAWLGALEALGGTGTTSANANRGPAAAAQHNNGYLPTRLAVQAERVRWNGHSFHQVVAGGTRDGAVWRINVDASEGNGHVDFHQPEAGHAGQVHARLARLVIRGSTATEVENLLRDPPSSIPALDIVVQDLDLRGKKLGRIEIEAINRVIPGVPDTGAAAREWRLNAFNIIVPEARFSAVGNWAGAGRSAAARGAADLRRTAMAFHLDVHDAGALLARLGMPEVFRAGKGALEGQVAWNGSPLALDIPSLGGQFRVAIESGQFLKADPGIAKLLGVLSLQSLPRRLALDFRDVFSEGFAFDTIQGDVHIEHGLASTNNLQMKGVAAAVLMEGRADIARETQDLKVVVVPEINAGTASLVASVINPVIGLTTFLTQLFLRQPLVQANTQEFHIDGTWADPRVTRVVQHSAPAAAPPASRPAQTGVQP